MPHEVEFSAAAAQQTRPLAEADYGSLIDSLRVAARDPFDPAVTVDTDDPVIRRVEFGITVLGIASVEVDTERKKLLVANVRWYDQP